MLKRFQAYKKAIIDYLTHYTQYVVADLQTVNQWGNDVPERLLSFSSEGKQIRGGLVLLASELYGLPQETALPVAAAMEMFQSGFLIHDDIMDQDALRRGKPSIHAQYTELSEQQYPTISDKRRCGESLAICAGDTAFFQGFELITRADVKPQLIQSVMALLSREYTRVTLAQMQDVYLGFSSSEPSETEILKVYRYKTARYTFSIPLMAGAMLANAAVEQIDLLEKLGEILGIIFQIKDDELGIFGQSDTIGKVTGSDITENKKTLLRYWLFETARQENPQVFNRLQASFGKSDLSTEELVWIRQQVVNRNVQEKLQDKVQTLSSQASTLIEELNIPDWGRNVFEELLDYSLNRGK